MSVATVYNNLNLFIKEGVVKELTYGDSASRYDFDLGLTLSRRMRRVWESGGPLLPSTRRR